MCSNLIKPDPSGRKIITQRYVIVLFIQPSLGTLNKDMVVINSSLEVGRPGPAAGGQCGGEGHACPVIS